MRMTPLPASILTYRSVVSKFGSSTGCALDVPCNNACESAGRCIPIRRWSTRTRNNGDGLDVSQLQRKIRTCCIVSANESTQTTPSEDENDGFSTRAGNLSAKYHQDMTSAASDTSAQEADGKTPLINGIVSPSCSDTPIQHGDNFKDLDVNENIPTSTGPPELLQAVQQEPLQTAKSLDPANPSLDPHDPAAPSLSAPANSSTIPEHEHNLFPTSSSAEPSESSPPPLPAEPQPSPPIAAARAVLAQHLAQHQVRSTARPRNPWWAALAALKPDDGGGSGGMDGPDVSLSTSSAGCNHETATSIVPGSGSAADGDAEGGGGRDTRGPNDSRGNARVREGREFRNGSSGGSSWPRHPGGLSTLRALRSAAGGLRVLPYASRPAQQPGGRYRELLRRDGGSGWGRGGYNGCDDGGNTYSSGGGGAGDGDGTEFSTHRMPAGAQEGGGGLSHPDNAPPEVFSIPRLNDPATAAEGGGPALSPNHEGVEAGSPGQVDVRSLPAPPGLIPCAAKRPQPPPQSAPYNPTPTDENTSLDGWPKGPKSSTFSRRLGLPWTAVGLLARVLHLNIPGVNAPRSRSRQKQPQLWDSPPQPSHTPSKTSQGASAGAQQSIVPSIFQQQHEQQEQEQQAGALLEWAMMTPTEGSGRGDLAQWSWVPAPDGRIHSSEQAAEALAALAAAGAAQARVAAALEMWAEEHPALFSGPPGHSLHCPAPPFLQLALWRPVELLNGRMALLGLAAGLTQQTASSTPLPLLQQAVQQPLSIPAAFAVIVLLTAVHRQVGHRMRTRGLLMSGRAHRWMGRVAMLGFVGAVVAEATDPAHRPVVQQLREWML